MENFFSRFGLDIIGKAVFNYDFDSLTHDDPVIQVCVLCVFFWGGGGGGASALRRRPLAHHCTVALQAC